MNSAHSSRGVSPAPSAAPCITCGICFAVLSEPLTLQCDHSFCLKCVRDKVDKTGVGSGVTCVLCNTHHPNISLRNLSELVDHNLAQHIAAVSRGADQRPNCQWCDEAVGTVFCGDCHYVLCSDCNVAVHKNSAKRNHAPGPISDARSLAKAASRKCGVKGHEEYRLEFYCLRCEQLCCAYCLQIGPHHAHDNVLVSKAAQEVRQQMGRDLESLGQIRAVIEGQAHELNRVHGQFLESYDHVESLVTDRFKAFRQQLLQKERDVRIILENLRGIGDGSLGETRAQFLKKLNSVNEAGLSFRRLQHGGADYEVLENRERMGHFLKTEVPLLSGTGFRLSDLGDLNLTGLSISLDLTSSVQPSALPHALSSSTLGGGGASANASRGVSGAPLGTQGARVDRDQLPPMQRRAGLRFTFLPDADVEMREVHDGLLFRCSDHPSSAQIGIRANETFDSVRELWAADNGILAWRIRLDAINETFLGVVDGTEGVAVPEGFYWRPMRQGHYNGKVGRPTHTLTTLPICRTGDVVRFAYDTNSKVLRLAVNNVDRGVIVTDLPPSVTPCFIFRPGEAATLLF